VLKGTAPTTTNRIHCPGQGRSITSLCMGVLAGTIGTATMDAVLYARFRRDGGTTGPYEWETSESAKSWHEASTPGQVGRRLVFTLTGRDLPDSAARTTVNLVHWVTGLSWGVAYALVGRGRRNPRAVVAGPLLGLSAFASGYAILPAMNLYEPIWTYDRATLKRDLSVHVVFGTSTVLAAKALGRAMTRRTTRRSVGAQGI
jgi:hypothetical protein